MKKYLTDEIIESVLKRKILVRKTTTHRNKNKNLNATNLVPSIFFYHRRSSLLLFSVANENLLKARAFLNNTIPLGIYLFEKIISHIR